MSLGRSRWHVLDIRRPPNSEKIWIAPQARFIRMYRPTAGTMRMALTKTHAVVATLCEV